MAGRSFRLEPARADHAFRLCSDMREDDAREVMASGGFNPLEALLAALEYSNSRAWAVYLHDELAFLVGVCTPSLLGPAVPWALTGTACDRHPRAFWEATLEVRDAVLAEHPYLVQRVDARYTRALRWAKRLGFHVHPAEPFGVEGRPFHLITLQRSDIHV